MKVIKKINPKLIEMKIQEFCIKKGWDSNKLTTEQMLIITKNIK